MLLKHLKQFTCNKTKFSSLMFLLPMCEIRCSMFMLSCCCGCNTQSTVFKTDVKRLARFYGSPAVCKSLTTSKVPKRLSREDRRVAVESFVSEYRATNAGKFPTLKTIPNEVGGSYYIVRGIYQEMKLEPKAPVPIVAKALSEVSASVPDDVPSKALDGTQSHSSACETKQFSPVVVYHELQERLTHSGSQDLKQTTLKTLPLQQMLCLLRPDKFWRERLEVKTEERSSAWSNIMSFAKEFATFWRKG